MNGISSDHPKSILPKPFSAFPPFLEDLPVTRQETLLTVRADIWRVTLTHRSSAMGSEAGSVLKW